MNKNIKEIGHVSFKLKDTARFRNWYENVLGLKVGFVLQKVPGEDYIIYYQLQRGQFIEIFPESSVLSWNDYDGHNRDELYSYQHSTLGRIGGQDTDHPDEDSDARMQDPEFNTWIVNDGEKYISKVTYHVKDLQKSVDFYKGIYELDVAWQDNNAAHIHVNNYQVIELIQHVYPEDNCTNNKGQCHYALIVHDIAAFAKDIAGKGVQIWHGPKTANNPYTEAYIPIKHSENTYNFYMQDPDDNEIEVMCYSEDSFQVKYAIQ